MNYILARLIAALIAIESGGDPNAVGDNGKALGCLQIHMVVVEDVNRIYGTAYTSSDRLDQEKSVKICELYLTHWGKHYAKTTGKNLSLEVLARIWNGGPKGYEKKATEKYWEKVRKELKK